MVSVEACTLAGRDATAAVANRDGLAVETHYGWAGLARLAGEWQALFDAAARPDQVFLTPAWTELWHRHYMPSPGSGEADPLVIVTCRDAGRLALVCPLVRVRRLGLTLLKWAGEPVSQYGDVLVAEGEQSKALLEAAWTGVLSLGADALILRRTRAGSPLSDFLCEKGAQISECQSAPFIDLEGVTCPKLQSERYSAKDRKNRRRHRKRLSEQGAVAFEWLQPSSEAGRLSVLAVALKRQWLTRRGRISKAFRDRRIEQFLAAALAGEVPGLDGRVGVIHCGAKPAAVLVGFLNKGYYAGFLTAYDGDFERYSPGSLLFEDAIRAAIGERLTRIDLLAPADRYKLDWAKDSVPVEDLCLPLTAGGGIYTRVIQRRLRRSLKSGLESLPPVLRRTFLYAVALLPALLCASSDP